MLKVNDLMVNLAAHAGAVAAPAYIYCAATCHVCSATCPDTSWGGCGYSWGCGITRTIVEAQAPPSGEQTALLKTQLKQALAEIEKNEAAK